MIYSEPKDLIGKTFISDCEQQAEARPLNAPEFTRANLPAESRVIAPGMMYTMDFRPERLNVHIDSDGKVTKVRYG